MAKEKTTAIILRTFQFSETSLVLAVFTREFGKINTLAKGARRLKGPFESALDLLTVCRIVFLRKSSEALDIMTEAKLVRRFQPDRNLSNLYAGYYVVELLNELTDDYDPHPKLFDIADEALKNLSEGKSADREILRFELGMLNILGLLPSFEMCVRCGCRIESTDRVAFGQLDGGVLCKKCRVGRKQVASVSSGALRIMVEMANLDRQTWRRVEIDSRCRGELRGILNHYFSNLLGRRPRMYEYLTKL